MGCKPAPACKKALSDATARWPKRNRASDGTCGDAAHAKRKSEHNPDASGYAHAFDLTNDPANGPDCDFLSKQVLSDPRVLYVIWEGKIWKSRTRAWEVYRGPNPHNHHMHVSIKPNATHDVSPWPWTPVPVLADPVAVKTTPPVIGAVTLGEDIAELKPQTELIPEQKPGDQVFTPAPNEVPKATPAEKSDVTSIPAIPPLPSRIPETVKKIFKWGAAATGGGIAGPFLFLRDNPNLLAPILGFFKWIGIGLAIGAGLYIIAHQADRMWKAHLANQLNIARLQNYGDENTKNIDFKGWKGVPEGEQPKV